MKVLNSSTAFLEHYATRAGTVLDLVKSATGGGAVASGVAGASALAVGHAAAGASLWSLGSSLPWIGGFCAGKATAVGIAASMAALGSAAVILPALAVGGGVACAIYLNRDKKPVQKRSSATELAKAFSKTAWLPVLACAIGVCTARPSNTQAVRDYLVREMGGWGYSEQYVNSRFDEAMKHSPSELNSEYRKRLRKLKSGSTEGIGATARELPQDVVSGFADDFKKYFKTCIG